MDEELYSNEDFLKKFKTLYKEIDENYKKIVLIVFLKTIKKEKIKNCFVNCFVN